MAEPVGRPSKYTQELADNICEQLSIGRSMRTVCLSEEMPAISTVFRWIRENEEFRQQYARAKEESTDALAEELLDISDDSSSDETSAAAIQRSRLRVDTRKWLMSKMKPKKYGEKLDLTTDGKELPTPIIPLNVLPRDNSNTKDIPANEED